MAALWPLSSRKNTHKTLTPLPPLSPPPLFLCAQYARRRAGKTDYKARRAMLTQDKNKYQAPKHRLVVRLTNSTVIVQVVKSTWRNLELEKKGSTQGDVVVMAAYSSELKNYGVEVGFKNYTAAYLTGYLCARRLLKSLELDQAYPGVEEPDGLIVKCQGENPHTGKVLKRKTYYVKELNDDKKPFRAFLDIGTRRTTTGARIFGAMKGAIDGGLDIPHNEKRFPGYIKEAKKYDADALRSRITGEHVKEYMEYLQGACSVRSGVFPEGFSTRKQPSLPRRPA